MFIYNIQVESTMDECQELKNIKYKTMLQNGDNSKLINTITNDISNMNLILENESLLNKKETWNKLDKSAKLEKILKYIDILKRKHKLTVGEINTLKLFINSNLDKRNLYRNKDVNYIKETGKIEGIPVLVFNNTTRKFSIKKSQQHISTAKSLGPKKNKKSKTVRSSSP